jgi:hypothetical protein
MPATTSSAGSRTSRPSGSSDASSAQTLREKAVEEARAARDGSEPAPMTVTPLLVVTVASG